MSTRVYVGKNLTDKEALAKGRKKVKKDWRCWNYNKKTGYAVFI